MDPIIAQIVREIAVQVPGGIVGSLVILCEVLAPTGGVMVGSLHSGVPVSDEMRLLAARLQALADDVDASHQGGDP